jgi:hypothetical protein
LLAQIPYRLGQSVHASVNKFAVKAALLSISHAKLVRKQESNHAFLFIFPEHPAPLKRQLACFHPICYALAQGDIAGKRIAVGMRGHSLLLVNRKGKLSRLETLV